MSTSLPAPGDPRALYLVDLSSYVFRAYHAITPLSNTKGEPTHATYGTVTMLQKLVGERVPAMLAVAMDSREKTFRHEIDPNYKATRRAHPPDLHVQMDRSREIVEAYQIPIFRCDGVEADDLIASVVLAASREGYKVVVVGADKDLMQLVDERVVLWDTMRDKVYGPPEVEAKFGVPPRQMRDLLALMGDSSDNVPGVPSVGPKTAADLLKQFGSFDGIYARLGEVTKKRVRELLGEHEADARLSLRLVTLKDDVPVELDWERLRYGGADLERLRAIYTELGFVRLIAQIPVASAGPAAKVMPSPNAAAEPAPREVALRTVTDADELEQIVGAAEDLGRIAIDLETSSPEAARAELIGLALSYAEGQGCYLPVAHRTIGAPRQLTLPQLRGPLGRLLSNPKVQKVGYDLKYASVVFARLGIPIANASFDVMVASYLIDPEADHGLPMIARRLLTETLATYDQVTERGRGKRLDFDQVDVERAAAYAGRNAEAIVRIAPRLSAELERYDLGPVMQTIEMPLLQVLAGMERCGVLVDLSELARLRERLDAELVVLERRAHEVAGREFNVNSPRQLEVILFDELGLKPIKRTKTGRSTDADVLEALAEQHELPGVLLEHRQLSKLKGTYIDALPGLVNPRTGRIHTEWRQAVAATGRIASNNPNLQNIPVRTDLGRSIRRAFVAPPGMRIVSADYSQIELRVLAHLSKDPVLVQAFRSGEDIHARTAMEIWGVRPEGVTEDMRRQAKTINFGVIYGMGEVALAKRLGIPRAQAADFISAYFRRYDRVRGFMEETLEEARRTEQVRTLFGRRRILPNLRSSNAMLRAAAERVAQNTPIQGTAADLLKLAMIRLADPVVAGARMVLTVHDELVFEIPEALVGDALGRIREAMESVYPSLEVPLVVDAGAGPNWGEIAYE